jgi:hypothetical protein
MKTPVAFTWQRYKQPIPRRSPWWRDEEKIMVAKEQAAQHPYAGMSVLDILWDELDTIMDQLMEEGAPEKSSLAKEIMGGCSTIREASELADGWYGTLKGWGELRGQAQGVAYAIAVCTNPYACDVPAIKREARARWDARQK